jgi:hypothetical protein
MNRITKGNGLFGAVTFTGGATLKGNTKGDISVTGYSRLAAGSSGWYYNVEQLDTVALTGTLRAGYFVATNGILAATGTIRGIEVKARAADSSNVGANVTYLEGISISADAKTKDVTRMYGIEIMLDGGAGGTVTTAVGLQISNNASDTQTASYAIRVNSTGGAHKAFTTDIILQNGETIDNATNGTIALTAAVLKLAFDAAAYMTVTVADGGAVTFADVSDGTAGFAFSQKVDITGTLGVVGATSITGVLTVKFDAAAYMTVTVADGGAVTFADVSDGTAGFAFSQVTNFTAGLNINTNYITVLPDATATIGIYTQSGTLSANPGSTVIAHKIDIAHSVGAGDCDDLIAQYSRVNITGDGDSGLTAVGIAARAYQGTSAGTTVASQVYGAQVWAKHLGTGTVAAMSALSAKLQINKTDAFTATNSINAGHFHLESIDGVANGAITSGNFDCVMMEVYPTVTGLQSVLNMAVETAATVGAWFDLNGGADVTDFFNISAVSSCVVIAAGTTMHHDPNAVTCDGHLIIKIGAVQYDIPFYDHA